MNQSSAPTVASAARAPSRTEHLLALVCFLAALCWQFHSVTLEWSSNALPGHTFRQTQTGHSARFIAAENNYSLAYPTPILGRPWSIPMEFPLYQWTVAALTQHTGLTLVESARTVSLACFYATLPAFWWLALLAGVPPGRRWWCLVPIVLSPVTILYGRAFLIETMALALAVWFVVSFIQMLRQRSLAWLAATAALGGLAGMTKATTLLVACLPCTAIGLRAFLRAWRNGQHREVRLLLVWGAAAALPVFLATWAWTRFADTTKALNPIGQALRSDHLVGFNFGQSLLADRLSGERWAQLLPQWETALAPVPLIAVLALLVAVITRPLRGPAFLCLATFLGAQLVFPLLYSIHDYYFVAIAGTAGLGWGLTLVGLAERRGWGRLGAVVLLALLAGFQVHGFYTHYRADMIVGSAGDDLTNELFRLTEDDEVLIIAGDEWNATIPYFAQRRALMFPFGTVNDPAVVRSAFDALAPDEVAALVLVRDERGNQTFLNHAAARFDLIREPLLRMAHADVYVTRRVMSELLPPAAGAAQGGADPVQVFSATMRDTVVTTSSLSKRQQRLFANMSPVPAQFHFEFGPAVLNTGQGLLINAHATTRLWFDPPSSATELVVEYGMFDSVWQRDGMDTDGVSLLVIALSTDGSERSLFRRHLDPRHESVDRGLQVLNLPLDLRSGERVLVISDPGPAGSRSFDWFYLRRIQFN